MQNCSNWCPKLQLCPELCLFCPNSEKFIQCLAKNYCYNLIMMLHARDNNIQSFAYTWLHKGNQNEFLKHPKIKWLDGGLEPPTSGLPVHCSTT